MNPADVLLAAMAKATSQAPIDTAALRKASKLPPAEIETTLQTLLDERRIGTCRLIKGETARDVYWPTGIVRPLPSFKIGSSTPAAAPDVKPTQEVPMKKEKLTQGDRLVELIAQHGPIIAHDLAERAKLPVKSLDAYLINQRADGRIVERKGYVEARGRSLKHYLTPAQASAWDKEAAETEAAPPTDGVSASEPPRAEVPDALEIPAFLRKVDAPDVAELRRKLHDQGNDLAAHRMILDAVRERLGVTEVQDILAALDARTGHDGRMALLLIDSDDQAEVESLDTQDYTVAHGRAITTVHRGHAARAIVVRILGEAVRTVEWKEAA